MIAATTDVVVAEPFQVCHEGQVYSPGETVTVPAELAAVWLAAGWATEAEVAK